MDIIILIFVRLFLAYKIKSEVEKLRTFQNCEFIYCNKKQ